MTNHYSIEIISKKVFLKATYRNGKFRRIEHIRGTIDRGLMDYLGKTIPVNENEISELNKKWFNKVNYQIEVKAMQTLNKRIVDSWFSFYEDMMDIKPKYTGADGNAVKQIASYLKSQATDEDQAFATWQMMLDNWGNLSEFHQAQLDLKYINSKLNVIIAQISKSNTNSSVVKGANGSYEL